MRIEGWHIDAGGHLREVDVTGLGPHLTVVVGPNESGKTTTHHLLRWILLGFPAPQTTAYKRYKPADGRFGGRLTVAVGDHRVVLERHAGDKQPTLTAPGGGPAALTLTDLVGHATAGLFERVFAVDIDDLQAMGSLDDDEVRERIFAAGTAGGGRSAREVVAELAEREAVLLSPRKGRIRDLRKELVEIDAARRAASAAAGDLPARREEARRLEEAARGLQDERDAARDRAARLARVLELWPVWSAAASARHDLAQLDPRPAVDLGPDPLGGLDRELEEVDKAEVEARQAGTDHEERADDLAAIEVDDRLAELAPRVDQAVAEADGEVELVAELAVQEGSEEVARRGFEEELATIGPGWTAERLGQVDVSMEAVDAVERAGNELVEARSRASEAERAHQRAATARQQAEEDESAARERLADATPGQLGDLELADARTVARQLRADIPALAAAQASAAERAATRRALADMAQRQAPGGGTPGWVGALAWAGVAVLVVGAAIAAVAGSPVGAAVAIVGASVLVAVAVGLGQAGSGGDAAVTPRADEADDDPTRAATGRSGGDDLAERVVVAARQVGCSSSPTLLEVDELLEGIEEAMAAARAVEERAAARASATTAEQEAAESLDAERAAAAAAEDAWRRTGDRYHLPTTVEPATATAMVRRLEAARRSAADLERLAESVESRRVALAEVRARRRQLLADAGEAPPDDEGAAAADLRALAERCAADHQARQRRDELTTEVVQLQRRHEAAVARLGEARAALAARFDAAGVDDADAYRALVADVARRTELADRVEEAERALASAFGTGEPATTARALLDEGDPTAWEERRRQLEDEARSLEPAHVEAVQRAHDAQRAVDELERSDELVALALRAEEARAELEDGLAEWAELRLARQAVEATLRRFEQERQPEVVRRATASFARICDGRWANLVPDEGQITVVDGADRRLLADALSRGATAQLYLAMRLALARSYAEQQGTALPLLLDDVLVDADDDRRVRVAEELATVADDLQVLVFTAREDTARLLCEVRDDTTVVALEAGDGRVLGAAEVAALQR